jgi:hypothetical protein
MSATTKLSHYEVLETNVNEELALLVPSEVVRTNRKQEIGLVVELEFGPAFIELKSDTTRETKVVAVSLTKALLQLFEDGCTVDRSTMCDTPDRLSAELDQETFGTRATEGTEIEVEGEISLTPAINSRAAFLETEEANAERSYRPDNRILRPVMGLRWICEREDKKPLDGVWLRNNVICFLEHESVFELKISLDVTADDFTISGKGDEIDNNRLKILEILALKCANFEGSIGFRLSELLVRTVEDIHDED